MSEDNDTKHSGWWIYIAILAIASVLNWHGCEITRQLSKIVDQIGKP